MVVAGGIFIWGFSTDWTFSGLLPREGAKCTPDEKDANAKQYVYDEDNECTVIESCKTNWKPNTSNTACISSSSGDTCTGANGTYAYNDSGVCTLVECYSGYTQSGTTCVENTCSPGVDEYSAIQDDKCLSDDLQSLIDCPGSSLTEFKDIRFKTNCDTSDIVNADFDLGIGGCQPTETIESHCNRIDGCIGYRRFGNGCARLILNAAPVCKHYGDQIYREFENTTIDDDTGETKVGDSTLYLNPSCANDGNNRYETRNDGDPTQPRGGSNTLDIKGHQDACSEEPECVGIKLQPNNYSHFLYKKSST